jgi:hypothetical protein
MSRSQIVCLAAVCLAAVCLAAVCLVGGVSAPALGADAPAMTRPPFLTSELFAFYSEPEINLHHFLFRWATLEAPPGTRVPDFPDIPLWESDRDRLAELTEAERKTWSEAVSFYGRRLVGRSLLFDRDLVAIRDALTGKGDRESVGEDARAVFEHLDRCLPIYRRHWWERHDRTNREWVAAMALRLVRYERRIASRIAAAYEAEWPSPPNRVDVVAYSNRTSAYTTGEPHSTISSADPSLRPPWDFEILFHEHSHSNALEQPLRAIVHRAFESRGLRPPRNLWHILLFATAGEVVRSIRVAAGEPDYVPYAWKYGVFTRSEIDRRAWKSIDGRWLPALAKGEPLSAVIDAIAGDLAPSMEAADGHR